MWIDTKGCSGMSLFERQERLSWQQRPCGDLYASKVHPAPRTGRFTTQEGWNVNRPPGCLENSSHMVLRHDLRTPPRAEHDGILQSDEA